MSKKQVIVKNMAAIQNFGAMDILCTDKTGTLTEDKIELIKHLNLAKNDCQKVLNFAYLNSFFQTSLKNIIDKTIIEHMNVNYPKLLNMSNFQKIDEIPFDFLRRKMSIVIQENESINLICKGATEEILQSCTDYELEGQIFPITKSKIKQIMKMSYEFSVAGFRVLALAYKSVKLKNSYSIKDENSLIFTGFIIFMDKIKSSATQTIKLLKQHGVAVKILTGDNEIVTTTICKKVGLNPGKPLLGSEIDNLSDDQLTYLSEKTVIFAKLNPMQKSRIVTVLKNHNHVVGFLGDGINDAVALHNADIGISVNNATDIAKEISDIILLKHDLSVLENGILEGRKTFINILKYLKITVASQFGNVLSLLIASC
jgi:Mg2+-importing ATPase